MKSFLVRMLCARTGVCRGRSNLLVVKDMLLLKHFRARNVAMDILFSRTEKIGEKGVSSEDAQSVGQDVENSRSPVNKKHNKRQPGRSVKSCQTELWSDRDDDRWPRVGVDEETAKF